PKKFSFPQEPYPELTADVPRLIWVNHGTFYVECLGLTILTDPIWSEYAATIPGFGPKRQKPPGISLNDLGPIHCILISHNHYDHLDSATIKKLHSRYPQATFCIPIGLKKWFDYRHITR